MQRICEKFTAAVLAFLMIISMGNGVLHPLAEVNTNNTQTSSKSTVKGGANEDIVIDATNFPDDNFRDYVSTTFDPNKTGVLSDEAIAGATEINCSNLKIESLQGINFFTAVQTLDCSKNQITSLDLDTSKLTQLQTFNGEDQGYNNSLPVNVVKNDEGYWTVDFQNLIENGKYDKVEFNDKKWSFDNNIAVYDDKDAKPEDLAYTYRVDNDYNYTLSVDLTLNPVTEWTVTFDSNGGSAVVPQTVADGECAKEPDPAPTWEGHTFEGWYNGDEAFDFTTPITENITLTAHWSEVPVTEWTVTFNSNGGSAVVPQIVNDGTCATKPADPTKEGYVFDGWYTDDQFTNLFDFNTPITENTTLYANWTDKGDNHTVTFDLVGGNDPKQSCLPQLVADGECATEPAVIPTRETYIFDGWYDGENLFDFTTPITADITLTAHWKEAKEVEPGIYKICSAINTDYALDVSGRSTEDTANVQLYQSNDTLAQRFDIEKVEGKYYTVTDMCSGKMLDVAGAGTENGTNLWQYSANGSDAQLWSIEDQGDGTWKFVSKCNGLCINVSCGEAQNGQNVWLWEEDQTRANKFVLTKDEDQLGLNDAPYTFRSTTDSNKVLDIQFSSVDDGANLQLYTSNGTDAQKFIIKYMGAGFYTITSINTITGINSGKVLDVAGAGDADCTNVAQYSLNYTSAQMWRIGENNAGHFLLTPECAMNKCLDIYGNSTEDGANAQIYTANGTTAQEFDLVQNS